MGGYVRYASRRSANADYIAKIGRIAKRPAHIAAVGQRSHTTCYRDRSAARASTACLGRIVRIVRRTEDWIERLRAKAKFRHVGLAQHNRARLLLPLHHSAIEIRHVVFV